MRHRPNRAKLVHLALVAAIAIPFAGAALAQERAPRDVTGNWLGRWNDKSVKGPAGRGVIGLELSQGGADGALTGLATPRDNVDQREIEGTYRMEGREMAGQVQIRVVGSTTWEPATVAGRCGKGANTIKIRMTLTDGERIKIKVKRFLDPFPSRSPAPASSSAGSG